MEVIMGFFNKILDLGEDIIKTPINVVKDGLDVLDGETPKNTVKGLKKIAKDVDDIIDDVV